MVITEASPIKSSALAVCSPTLASKSPTEILLRQWVVKFAEIKREEFTKAYVDIWCEALSDLEPEWVEFGCRVYLRSMKFFPMPGDIREIVEEERETRRVMRVLATCTPASEIDEEEAAIEESSRQCIPTKEILRQRRNGRL